MVIPRYPTKALTVIAIQAKTLLNIFDMLITYSVDRKYIKQYVNYVCDMLGLIYLSEVKRNQLKILSNLTCVLNQYLK